MAAQGLITSRAFSHRADAQWGSLVKTPGSNGCHLACVCRAETLIQPWCGQGLVLPYSEAVSREGSGREDPWVIPSA